MGGRGQVATHLLRTHQELLAAGTSHLQDAGRGHGLAGERIIGEKRCATQYKSASPLQRNWSSHRVLNLCSRASGLQMGGLQLEIPLRWTVGIVDQHEVRVVQQAFSLQFHRAPVLLDEFGKNELQKFRTERQPAKNIPGGDYVNAAVVASNRRNRCE